MKSICLKAWLVVLVCSAGAVLRATEATRPNILFFITDDESWLERSAYGWSTLPTPAFDRVAKEGVLFTNGFTSAPSCAPSRASVLTGRNFWELKQGAFIQGYLPKEFPIFTDMLEEHGYHVGSTDKVWGPGVHNRDSHGRIAGTPYNDVKVSNPPFGISPIDYAVNFGLFLEDKAPGQPFFFWAGVTEPHGPYDSQNHMRLEKEFGVTLDEISMPPYVEDTRTNRESRANFLYEICYADRHLGLMLERLESLGELDNTLVVVTSDNGTHVTDGMLVRGKASPYDFGVHEPFAVMWPSRVPAGRTVTDFVSFRDLAPTFLDAAGLQPPESMTGKSLVPAILSDRSGRVDEARNWIMTGLEWHGEFDPETKSSRTIRDDNFSYVARYENVDADLRPLSDEKLLKPYKTEFYNIKSDPWEQNNLIDAPDYADEIGKLTRKMAEYGFKTGDPRFTGDMDIFRRTRAYVQSRKRIGYVKTMELPFDEVNNSKH